MGLTSWLNRTYHRSRNGDTDEVRRSIYELYQGLWRRAGKAYQYLFPRGESVFSEEWDLLIVLDGCRTDLMEEVASEYDFLDQPDSFISLGSTSSEWLEKNFVQDPEDEINSTGYITGNPFTDEILSGGRFAILDEVWQYSWDEEIGTIQPRSITDRAIQVSRSKSPNKLIVHYMQPHFPSIPHPGFDSRMLRNNEGPWDSVWAELQLGKVRFDEVWDAYLENLRFVLDDVSLLLQNVDAEKVVITADHGNLVGEFGLYGHPGDIPLDGVKRVPWYITSAIDEETYSPNFERKEMTGSVKHRLQSLGYAE